MCRSSENYRIDNPSAYVISQNYIFKNTNTETNTEKQEKFDLKYLQIKFHKT